MGVETLVADFAFESLVGDTIVGAATDLAGGEFLAADVFADTVTIYDTAAPSLAELGGSAYQEVGSFAGNAEWVNNFYPGSIVDAPEFSEFTYTLQDFVGPDVSFSEIQTSPMITVDDSGVSLLPQDVQVINSGELSPSIYDQIYSKGADLFANANVSNVVTNQVTNTSIQVAKQVATGTISQATGINPQLINYTLGSAVGTYGNVATPGIVPNDAASIGYVNVTGSPYDDEGNLNLGWELNENNDPVYVGPNNPLALTPENVITGAGTTGGNFVEVYNSTTGRWDVFDTVTNQTVVRGLTQQGAILAAQDFSINQGIGLNTGPAAQQATGPAYDASGVLNPGWILGSNGIPVFTGTGQPVGATIAEQANANLSGLLQQLQQQQTIRDQRQNKAAASDWRVRLRLAPQSNYLYNDPACGPVLWPLRNTDGIIFPYTPSIDTAYKANYEAYDLTHSNYRGYFYKGSYTDAVNLRATFTAQDTSEANYLLAVIHFFRSATKMFYGQDAQRGSPPPLVYLSGLGDYQFNEHPCVIAQFNYNLPADVDYIRAQSSLDNGTNLLTKRNRQYVAGNPLSYALQRLATVGLPKGGLDARLAAPNLGIDNPTYVPTKMDIQLMLYPIQSRSQVSQQFSLRNFANGNLLKGGFW